LWRKKEDFWLPWFEVNTNPSWVLRELIDEVYTTFNDDDFADMLLELDKPFDELLTEEECMSGKGEIEDSCIEKSISSSSLRVDIANCDDPSGENEMQKEEVGSEENEEGREDEDEGLNMLGKELSFLSDRGEKSATLQPTVLMSGYLMMKGVGRAQDEDDKNDKWRKSFFVVVEKPNEEYAIDIFDREGGVLRGSIPCDGSSDVVSSTADKHGIRIRSQESVDVRYIWKLKAESAEMQYKWVSMFARACRSEGDDKDSDDDDDVDDDGDLLEESQVDVIIDEETAFSI
jgi:hypothetical protein